jgi:predicted ester cyclase
MTTPQQARDLVAQWLRTFEPGEPVDPAEIAAPHYVEHAIAPFASEAPGAVEGPAHLRATAAWLRAQFPDLVMRTEAIAIDGDLVALRVTSTGTNLGPLNGVVPPTGRQFTASQSHWFRIADGRLAEHWATRDDLGAMLQLGVLQPPGRPGAVR